MKISIVIPAYNEEKRLPRTLDKIIAYLGEYYKSDYELILVDDGSTDDTAKIIGDYLKKYRQFRMIRQPVNAGRGAAVRIGVLESRGDFILETDADGSVEEEAILRFLDFFENHPDTDVIIGSRNVSGSEILTPQPILRVFLGYVFLLMARLSFGWSIKDFTLGFKMFRKEAAKDIFARQIDNRYVAEAEIVVIAKKRDWRLKELPVLWTDFRESKVHPFRDSFRSLSGMIKIIFRNYNT